ncbi:alpha/beta fold hydrolase [Pyruvatibacter sp.]|uniref:alpha/beta hydrolase n=1 Tax=Pyruvatibacter sp. TaxID=1981328 RepID=UPI0032EEE0C4
MTGSRNLKRIAVGAAILVPLAVLVVIAGVLPPMLTAAERNMPTDTPADYGISYEDVALTTSDGVEISGWWMPDATPPGTDTFTGLPIETQGVIIFVHGANSHRADPYANAPAFFKLLTQTQHHVLAIDMRNAGKSGATDGQLDWGRAEARDVLAAVDYVDTRAPGVPIIAFGVSMGGAAVINAALEDKRIRALVLLDPLLDTYDTVVNGAVAAADLPKPLAHMIATSAGLFHGVPTFSDTPLDRAKPYDRPTLVIQDEKDPVNRRIHAERLAAANRNVDLWVAPHPGDDHPHLADAGGWGTHVAAFHLYPDEVTAIMGAFLTMVHAICRAEDLEAELAQSP